MTAVCFDYVIAQLLHERNNVRKDQEKDCKTSIIGKSCAIYIILIHTVQWYITSKRRIDPNGSPMANLHMTDSEKGGGNVFFSSHSEYQKIFWLFHTEKKTKQNKKQKQKSLQSESLSNYYFLMLGNRMFLIKNKNKNMHNPHCFWGCHW